MCIFWFFFFFKQKTAYEVRISDWSSDVCSSDLIGGPTANMYRMACKDPKIEAACRRPSCVFPDICPNLNTSHDDLIRLYRKVRETKGIKKVMVASGVRYDLAVKSPEYTEALVTHHVGGYLKIAPEPTARGPPNRKSGSEGKRESVSV